MGFKGWPAKRELEKFLIRGIDLSEEKSDRRPSDPLTFDVVKEIRKSLDKNSWKNSSKNTVWAGVCVGYFGAFRASELFMNDNCHIDYSSDLVWNDVKFQGKNPVEIKIRNPKTGGGKFELVELFKFPNKRFCPVRALKVLKKLLAKSKFRNWNISAKSMRAGIPSDLENFPDLLNDGHIKVWGRGKSNVYQRYMKNKNPPRKWIFEKICQAILPLCS